MPTPLRPIRLAFALAATAAGILGCGGSSGPDPSVPPQDAAVLRAKIDEIKANVDVGSCVVAADKTDDLLADIANLPASVNNDVKQALDDGANNLKLMLSDPTKCQGRSETTTTTESTTAPTTTEETTTERTHPETTTERTQTQPTTTTQTQPPQTTTPGDASGGIGPGGL